MKAHGRARIHEQSERTIRICFKLPDQQFIVTERGALIQKSKIIARHVIPVPSEFNAGATLVTAMATGVET